jgi:hypothetical protein
VTLTSKDSSSSTSRISCPFSIALQNTVLCQIKSRTPNVNLSGPCFQANNKQQDAFISSDKGLPYFTKTRRLISLCRCFVPVELDLDYLERRGEHAREPRGPPPETETSPDSMDLVKVILLGAPAVGKTSIIQVSYARGLLLQTKFLVGGRHYVDLK